jgi:hypothetical protein
MDWNKLISTKFIATVGCGLVTSLLCWFGKIDGNVYATVIIATVGAFIVGDVTQKVKEAANNV